MSGKAIFTIVLVSSVALLQPGAGAQENLIVNGEFDDGLNGWFRYGTTGFNVELAPEAGLSGANAVVIDVTDQAATTSIGIAQPLAGGLVQGEVYPIGFTARAEQPREMVVLFQLYKPEIPQWLTLWEEKVQLTKAPQTYTFEYEHTTETTTTNPDWSVDIYYMLKGQWWPMEGDDQNTKVWLDRLYFGAEPPLPRRDLATRPEPADGATDVWRDTDLGWTPGAFAQTHDIYFGATLGDVNTATRANPMGVLLSQGQSAVTYDPGRLAFDQTYYWRVDEVNGPPDNAVIKGTVWSFATEPLAYPIADVVATSNALSTPKEGPVNAVDGSGIDANDFHSTTTSAMWLGSPGADPIYIQFEFDRVYELHEMLVWNYNAEFEMLLGFGLKDVTVEYSQDGSTWTMLGQRQLAQATARPDYAANTTIEFGGAAARYVRLTVLSGWGVLGQYGLSEVRFLYIPAQARYPEPVDVAAEVNINAELAWRSGREAATHEVFLDTDPNAVATGTVPVATTEQAAFMPEGLAFGSTYYWKVNEVNQAEAVPSWEGSVWSFTVQEFATIDDFEAYNDGDNVIYETWLDGWVNDTGSTVGYFDAPFAEMGIVHGGRQSMPLFYENADSPFYSEAERTWSVAQDWSVGEADSLRLYVYGAVDNEPDTLYVRVEDSGGHAATVRHENADVLAVAEWQAWTIPYSLLAGVNMSDIEKMAIGVGDPDTPTAGGRGIFYVDDIEFGRPSPASPEGSL